MLEAISVIVASALATPFGTGGAIQPAAAVPPITVSKARPKRVAQLISWDASEITCENGVTFASDTIPRRIPFRSTRAQPGEVSVQYTFTLGPDGRALSITEAEGNRVTLWNTDLAPALAAARFGPQSEPAQCSVTFTKTQIALAEATLADLITLKIHNRNARVPSEAWSRFVSGDCSEKRRRALEIHTPDYRKLPKIRGANNWTFLSYNIDETGAPDAVETIGGTGESRLDAASRKAVADSRWIDEDPRQGCWRYDFTAADVIEAPKAPDLSDFGKWPDQCESDDRWSKPPVLTYPKPFQKRGIEGWAIFRYDVASWGEIGNVELLEAQPAMAFGGVAERVLKSAQYKPRKGGLTGCVEKVVFRLPEKETDRSDGAE